MGAFDSKPERDLPTTEKFFGFENYDNTCYCNSVLQALYFCRPFRDHVIAYFQSHKAKILASSDDNKKGHDDTLLQRLAELFAMIAMHKKQTGVIGPKRFVHKLRKENEFFQGDEHQDAHEFLNYLLNEIMNVLQKEAAPHPNTPLSEISKIRTWVHELFEGTLTNQTRCMSCETVTSMNEPFIDLSVDVQPNRSLTACLSKFSSVETLGGADKFYCDKCCGLHEAQKRMLVKKLPPILTVHLKRFKFMENIQQFRKNSSRVVFPFELRVCNTSDDCAEKDRLYHLFACVVHSGSGLNHGHYVCVVRSHHKWLLFDDERVDVISIQDVQTASFGSTVKSTDVAYLLFYTSNLDHGTNTTELSDTESQTDASSVSRRAQAQNSNGNGNTPEQHRTVSAATSLSAASAKRNKMNNESTPSSTTSYDPKPPVPVHVKSKRGRGDSANSNHVNYASDTASTTTETTATTETGGGGANGQVVGDTDDSSLSSAKGSKKGKLWARKK